MKHVLSLTLCTLMALFLTTDRAQAQVPMALAGAFSKYTKQAEKFMGKAGPWLEMVKKNDALIPAALRPKYDGFVKAYDGFTQGFSAAKLDPSKVTTESLGKMNTELGDLTGQFKELQKDFKGLPFVK